MGYQPDRGSTPGYTVVVAKATRLTLVNFGCGGATTTSLVSSLGCPDVLPHTVGGVTYPSTTQEAAALSFLDAHKGHIGLITVSIGGNDVTACAEPGQPHSLRRHRRRRHHQERHGLGRAPSGPRPDRKSP